jgi:hypothetical protein
MYEYVGMMHIHSTYSDGSRPISEIAAIASDVNLDFLCFTDHNTLAGKHDGLEGWHNDILVIIGYEINDAQDLNHFLAFNIDKELPSDLKATEYVRRVKELDGLGIIAHPHEKRKAMKAYPPYPWDAWDTHDYHGLEIWNQMSEWMEGLTHFNKYWRAVHPRRSIIAPPAETLVLWDKVNQTRRVVGVGGVDAHGHKYKLLGFFKYTVFRYKISFKTIRTHILVHTPFQRRGNDQADIAMVYEALRNCRCFISNLYCGNAAGFRFYAENSAMKVTMGEQLKFDPYSYFHVNLPKEAEVIFICDGKQTARASGRHVTVKIKKKGVYRVEIHRGNRPWIFSNHIRII